MRYCLTSGLMTAGAYALLLICVGVSLYSASVLFAILREKGKLPVRRRYLVPRNAFPLLAAAVCLYFLHDMMFRRFSCVELGSDQIRLGFLWPKPPRVIPA